ncbi:SAP domain-containing protein [Lactobacillus sp. ESL0681]|uniref:SAP domain-containing protein n=1 Tax=Lactobacillus sp. ESL0681 TaxID=2983211 RepID=UPI0023F8A780|nr:SAP domain-containing protein [Lactobacillus sp. ESL0681]WEV40938.1 SAP domain-containing protein [Lactobacillus sp. ESL0681]
MEIPQNLTQFKATYYYKTDLVKLCRKFCLPAIGTKAELNSYLIAYFSGIPARDIKPKRKNKAVKTLKAEEISLNTKVVGSGFKFNNEARKFFAAYFGLSKFSFKKEMAIVKRKAERENDTEMTVKDLLQQAQMLSRNQIDQVAEELTYQWNNFVRDFFQDKDTSDFHEPLKVAALLWRHVRSATDEKVYCHELLTKYAQEISSYRAN